MDVAAPRTGSSDGLSDGDAERSEAIQDGHANLELGDMTVEVPCQEARAQQFDTMHPCFDAAPVVMAAPSSPDGSTEAE